MNYALYMVLFTMGTFGMAEAQVISDCNACLPITIRRITPGSVQQPPIVQPPVIEPPVVEPPKSEPLKVPTFGAPSGLIGFGDQVSLTLTDAPAGTQIEFSTDGGTTWTTGTNVTIDGKKDVQARSRLQTQTSDVVTASFSPYYRRMMVVGNSIMDHAPEPEIGWFNFNGMAASAPEKDFMHLLDRKLATLYAQTDFRRQSGGNFERFFGMPSYSLSEFDERLQEFKPDLIVVRIGENVDEGAVTARNLDTQFRQLLDKLAMYGQPVRIVVTTSVWNRPQTDAVIRVATTEKKHTLVDLSSMVGQGQYFASQYADPGVAAHPNDAGMQRIADLIWEAIR